MLAQVKEAASFGVGPSASNTICSGVASGAGGTQKYSRRVSGAGCFTTVLGHRPNAIARRQRPSLSPTKVRVTRTSQWRLVGRSASVRELGLDGFCEHRARVCGLSRRMRRRRVYGGRCRGFVRGTRCEGIAREIARLCGASEGENWRGTTRHEPSRCFGW
jgi:hypothetical protein